MQSWKLIDKFNVAEFFPSGISITHAQLPTPILISKDYVRIYFATRDERQFSSIYFIDLEYNSRSRDFKWHRFSPEAILSPGDVGTFDEHGVYPSSVLKVDNIYYLYYIGWNKGLTPPLFYSSIGLAKSRNGVNFSKISDGPILGRNLHEPYLVTSPFVEVLNGIHKMYYVSGNKWVHTKERLESRYDIKSIESTSLTNWSSDSKQTVIPLRDQETNIARPWILDEENDRLMYFSFLRQGTTGYQVGVARETRPGNWMRLDDELHFEGLIGSEPMAYPSVVQIGGEKLMFLNGENFGKKGFFIFKLDSSKSSAGEKIEKEIQGQIGPSMET